MGGQGLLTAATGTGGNAQVPDYGAQTYQNAATNFQSQYGSNPYVQAAQANAYGNLAGAQQAVSANRVNQQTPFGSLEYSQSGTDAYGNPTYTASQSYSPEVMQGLSGLTGQINQNIAGGFNPQLPSYGINPNETYSDAILRRLEPVQQRQQQQLETRLANQGIMRGSEAYSNAMTDFSQKQNDQLTSAVIGGMQTGLAANQQAYGQALQNYNLPLTQLSSYRTATAPTYINAPSQAAVAGPDVLGAYTSSTAADIAQQNADAAKQAALTGGLFQLGGSVLSNPNATNAISSGLGSIYNAVKGLIP
jgi:hypothetical protein